MKVKKDNMINLKFPYKGERKGKKCMRCSVCGLIHEYYLWYLLDNSHYCKRCKQWRKMINLDNEKFNPTIWIPKN